MFASPFKITGVGGGGGGKVLSPILSLHDPNVDARNLKQICNSFCKNLSLAFHPFLAITIIWLI